MKNVLIFVFLIGTVNAMAQSDPTFRYLNGNELFATVVKYTSLGEHRTGTPADFATSEWLGKELVAAGYEIKYHPITVPIKFFDFTE